MQTQKKIKESDKAIRGISSGADVEYL